MDSPFTGICIFGAGHRAAGRNDSYQRPAENSRVSNLLERFVLLRDFWGNRIQLLAVDVSSDVNELLNETSLLLIKQAEAERFPALLYILLCNASPAALCSAPWLVD